MILRVDSSMGSNIDSGRFGASQRSFGAHYILSFQTGRLKQLFDQFPGVLDSAATKWRWHVHIQQGLHRTSMGCFTEGSMIENMTSFISYIRCILQTLKTAGSIHILYMFRLSTSMINPCLRCNNLGEKMRRQRRKKKTPRKGPTASSNCC